MKEYISRADLVQKLTAADMQKSFREMGGVEAYYKFVALVNEAPEHTAKWKIRMNEKTCTECGFIYYSNGDLWNYCPNCGADMRGEA